MVKKHQKQSLVLSGVMLALCALLCLIPDTRMNVTNAFPREQVRIEEVDNSLLDAIGIAYNGVQTCRITVLTGEYKGMVLASYNYLNSALDKDKLYEAGDTAWAMLQPGNDKPIVTLIDHYRTETEAWIFGILALILIAFGV